MNEKLATLSELSEQLPTEVVKEMELDLIRLVRRSTRWLLRNRRENLDLEQDVPLFRRTLELLLKDWRRVVGGDALQDWDQAQQRLTASGVQSELAAFFAASHHLYSLLGIVEVAAVTGDSPVRVAHVLFDVGERLHLHWFSRQMHEYQAASQWEALARESLQDDLNWQQAAISLAVISEGEARKDPDKLIGDWMDRHNDLVQRWMVMQSEIRASATRDLSIFTVAIRELMDLSQSSLGTSARLGPGKTGKRLRLG